VKKIAIVSTALLVAACGVDGKPEQPSGGVEVTLSSSGAGLGLSLGSGQ